MNDRQMRILQSLSNLEILTRSQIQALHNTKGVRNTNYIMQSLKYYTNILRLHENAYYLNKRGVELTGARRLFRINEDVEHTIMRNDAYIYFKPTEWYSEQEVVIGNVKAVPDAYFYSGMTHKFLEVDNTQRWGINVRKFEQYKQLKDTEAFQLRDGRFPTLVWVVRHESRLEKLRELAGEYGLACEVYLHEEIKNIRR